MSNSIERHVDGRIRKRFNNEFFVPWNNSTQTLSPGTSPFFQPINDNVEFLLSFFIVSLKVIRIQVFSDGLSPFILTIPQEPLIARSYDTDIFGFGDDFALWLVVWTS